MSTGAAAAQLLLALVEAGPSGTEDVCPTKDYFLVPRCYLPVGLAANKKSMPV